MDKTEILALAEKFFDAEYSDLKNYFEYNVKYAKDPFVANKERAVNYSLQRCLGVALFVQNLGVGYVDIEPLYNEIQKKMETLL